MSINIKSLSDYSAIKKLASALHRFDSNQHGAAIMIGAGFSRSAARHVGGEKKLPLWYEFSEKLAAELNPNEKKLNFSDPLRLAEEYRSYFGQAALNDRIRSEIDDGAWRTGELYQSLLKLPWSEVMTTNWDTLLERAAKDILSPYYTPVTKASDFTWAQSPRIVKLHGTIGTTDSFIAAQEDYRTYPEKFAPFVNFARQVFIEKELCLLGFSGDDPNFLHWAGWVRDNLAGHARKIYLVGALKLTASRRKHLESINIAPIDLWDAVKGFDGHDLQHKMATEFFLQAMRDEGDSKAKPYKWVTSKPPVEQANLDDFARKHKDHEYAAALLVAKLSTLQTDRNSYPGWLVCPPSLRWQVKSQIMDLSLNQNSIDALAPNSRAQLLYEIAWRYAITFDYIAPWLVNALFKVANSDESFGLSKSQQMEIALLLLRNSRYQTADNESDDNAIQEQIKILTTALEANSQYLVDCAAEIAYHKATLARDKLDYFSIEALIEKIEGEDVIWKYRKSSLLMTCGRFSEGKLILAEAYRELRERYRYDQNSIHILSRLALGHLLLKAATEYDTNENIEPLPITYKEWLCDPWDWIESIREIVSKQQEKYFKNQNPIKPSFAQGHYRDNSNQRNFSNETSEFLLLNGLMNRTGIPLRSGSPFMMVDLLASTAERLVLSGGIGVELWDFILTIHCASNENSASVEGVLSRIGIARASEVVVSILVTHVLHATEYWRERVSNGTTDQRQHAISALRVLVEVLARLVVRVSPIKAKEIFHLAVSIGQQANLQHFWMSEALDHLLSHSLESVPKSEQGELLAIALAFPLQSEAVNESRWPNPVIYHPNERSYYIGIEKRINELIEVVSHNGSNLNTEALARLLPLAQKEGFLKINESEKLAIAIWGNPASFEFIPNINLYPHALLLFPSPNDSQTKVAVQNYLFEHGEDVLADTQKELRSFPSPEIQLAASIYMGMANAAAHNQTRLLPSPEQASKLFERLVAWRPSIERDDFFGSSRGSRKQLIESICSALSYAIVPALSESSKTIKSFEELHSFYLQIDEAAAVIPAFVYFSHLDDKTAITVEKIIQKFLQGRKSSDVSYAATALQKWQELLEAPQSPQFSRLISRLIVIIESGRTVGLQYLLWVAGELFKSNLLSVEQITTLKEVIPNVFDAADYTNIEASSQEAISASSIRGACVKLAITLISEDSKDNALHDLLESAKVDALPEVRFAQYDV